MKDFRPSQFKDNPNFTETVAYPQIVSALRVPMVLPEKCTDDQVPSKIALYNDSKYVSDRHISHVDQSIFSADKMYVANRWIPARDNTSRSVPG